MGKYDQISIHQAAVLPLGSRFWVKGSNNLLSHRFEIITPLDGDDSLTPQEAITQAVDLAVEHEVELVFNWQLAPHLKEMLNPTLPPLEWTTVFGRYCAELIPNVLAIVIGGNLSHSKKFTVYLRGKYDDLADGFETIEAAQAWATEWAHAHRFPIKETE